MSGLLWHRLQFGFTITYHYLFPQLTMGLSLLILLLKVRAVARKSDAHGDAARFWGRIFALNFAMGVVTGIPMEFQFGTNWARFSHQTGGVIGLTLAMEGMFAFFAESAFLGLFLFGEKRLGPKAHLATAFMVFLGAWLSGYFIIATNAFMQFPRGHRIEPDGTMVLADMGAYLGNPWAIWQYAHTMTASVVTAAFVMAGLGAYWALQSYFSRRETAAASWWLPTSRSRWRRWRANSRAAPTPSWSSSASRTRLEGCSTTRFGCPPC